jgi:hypothetical protein
MPRRLSPISNAAESGDTPKQPISPLVGEMSGRTEGGAKELGVCSSGCRRPYPAFTCGWLIDSRTVP